MNISRTAHQRLLKATLVYEHRVAKEAEQVTMVDRDCNEG